ncbi:hypothetical protein DW1_1236 [Proteiniborus sp. DW1]|uniref:DUF7916 family protein n=1 Tax=Proteiniborus sp. DW1 TaxID=1889883 RepID=UPI00092DEF8B|nr:PEP phosphonomutase [Proteiniborus sp. DW1]SCG82809.1 hypothetical protein DW1_1236 [Proteiniborus sp. DW1]
MYKRILDLNSSDIVDMTKEEKLLSIKAAEGRTVLSEVITIAPPILYDVSNVELASAFGADMLLLNSYDVNKPKVIGLPINEGEEVIREIKRLTGRLIGINLEPVDLEADIIDQREAISEGRLSTVQNVQKALEQGADMVVFTGNPKTGVTNKQIVNATKKTRETVGDKIIITAGKMHAAGSGRETGSGLIDKNTVKDFIEAGCDIVLLPAPGTVPGMTVDYIRNLVEYVHSFGKLAMTSIGTSQEGADESTIRSIALYSKMTGADIHHIGDSGMVLGMATPENIMIYSIAIKGKRHTYRRMARSVNR